MTRQRLLGSARKHLLLLSVRCHYFPIPGRYQLKFDDDNDIVRAVPARFVLRPAHFGDENSAPKSAPAAATTAAPKPAFARRRGATASGLARSFR